MTATTTDGVFVFESCNSTWLFDTAKMRFRRVLKGTPTPSPQAGAAKRTTTAWQPYYGLVVEQGSEWFTVVLNPAGTNLLRSWRHLEHCEQCGGERGSDLSASELASTVVA